MSFVLLLPPGLQELLAACKQCFSARAAGSQPEEGLEIELWSQSLLLSMLNFLSPAQFWQFSVLLIERVEAIHERGLHQCQGQTLLAPTLMNPFSVRQTSNTNGLLSNLTFSCARGSSPWRDKPHLTDGGCLARGISWRGCPTWSTGLKRNYILDWCGDFWPSWCDVRTQGAAGDAQAELTRRTCAQRGVFSTPSTSSCHCKQTACYLLWAES